MATKCRFSNCKWLGDEDLIFDHFEGSHRSYIREISKASEFVLSANDLKLELLILVGNNGLYWLAEDVRFKDTTKGIFAIGSSERIDYIVKFDGKQTGKYEYRGPFSIQSEYSGKFDVQFASTFEGFTYSKLVIYFGSDYKTIEDENVALKVDDSLKGKNSDLVEKFTCCICWDYIRRNARFCTNRHFTCDSCFLRLIEKKSAKCPLCRQWYPYDTQSLEVENILRFVQFPEQ